MFKRIITKLGTKGSLRLASIFAWTGPATFVGGIAFRLVMCIATAFLSSVTQLAVKRMAKRRSTDVLQSKAQLESKQ